MEKTIIKSGWLVMAAALTFGFTACSNDDDVIDEQPQQPAVRTIQVTVGAGIDNGTTRATIGESNDLYFTSGDKLFIEKDGVGYGTLSIDQTTFSESTTKTKSATFTGSVTITGSMSETFTLNDFKATLIPYIDPSLGETSSISTEGNTAKYIWGYQAFATDDELKSIMAKHAYVTGTYNTTNSQFDLDAKSSFLKFQVSNTDGTFSGSHDVKILPLDKTLDHISVTADGDGKLNFVTWLEVKPFPFLLVEIDSDKKVFVEGRDNTAVSQGNFAAKLYKLNLTAENRTELAATANNGTTLPTPLGKAYTFTDDADFTLTGEGMGYTFALNKANGVNKVTFGKETTNGTITKRTGITALSENTFITCAGDLTIDLIGTTNIRVPVAKAIDVTGNLKLSCSTVSSATLIVTLLTDKTTATSFKGLYGSNYNGDDAASELAASSAYSVTRTGYDNGDGTYTFRYKVKKI